MTDKYGWDPEALRIAVQESRTIAEALMLCNKPRVGSNYRSFRRAARRYKIDYSHFDGVGRRPRGRPLEEILVTNSTHTNRGSLKKRLIAEGVLEDKCHQCGIREWLGESLSLHLDHINGQGRDNRIDNLRLLCPNCHSQTPTYCGRNRVGPSPNLCPGCSREISRRSSACVKCWDRPTKIDWPPPIRVAEMVRGSGFTGAGRRLGVSDNAIRKFLKKHQISI